MSVEVNSYEELHICNVNEKTAAICGLVGEYLIANWGINSLQLTVDGKQYESNEAIAEGSDLYSVCKGLAEAEEILLAVRASGAFSVGWRLEESFMKHFTDDADVKANVTYRCTEYYDTDPGVEMYLYNENGLQRMQYTGSAACVANIKEWYCYTPTFRIADEEQQENTELHERIMAIVNKLCGLLGLTEDDMEDRLDDDWAPTGRLC